MTQPHPPTMIRREVCGMTALLVPTPGSGIIAAQIFIKRGSADEAANETGVSAFTASMLKRGTKSRSSAQMAFDLESLGASVGYGGGSDAATASLQSATDDFSGAFTIFSDALMNPVFDPREMEIERQTLISALRRIEDEKFDYTYRQYIKRIFEGHGYGRPSEGEIADVEAITADACRAWHDRVYHPSRMLLAAVGDFNPDEMRRMIEKHWGNWASRGAVNSRTEKHSPLARTPSSLTLEKDLEQGFIVMGFLTPEVSHPDHAALRLASAALGEGFSGRLFRHLRDERSLAYAVGSMLRSLRLGGHMALYIGTQPERLDEARDGLLAEAEALRERALDTDDLERARKYVIGKYLMGHQSHSSRAAHLAQWEDSGLGAEHDWKYIDDLKRVTADQIHEVARKWWVNPTAVILKPAAKSQS